MGIWEIRDFIIIISKGKKKKSEVLSFTKFLLTSKDLFLVMIPVLLACGI